MAERFPLQSMEPVPERAIVVGADLRLAEGLDHGVLCFLDLECHKRDQENHQYRAGQRNDWPMVLDAVAFDFFAHFLNLPEYVELIY